MPIIPRTSIYVFLTLVKRDIPDIMKHARYSSIEIEKKNMKNCSSGDSELWIWRWILYFIFFPWYVPKTGTSMSFMMALYRQFLVALLWQACKRNCINTKQVYWQGHFIFFFSFKYISFFLSDCRYGKIVPVYHKGQKSIFLFGITTWN